MLPGMFESWSDLLAKMAPVAFAGVALCVVLWLAFEAIVQVLLG